MNRHFLPPRPVVSHWLLAFLFTVLAWSQAWASDTFLPPEEAFVATAAPTPTGVAWSWRIAPGYHLYRDSLSLQPESGRVAWPQPLALPPGIETFDANKGKTVQMYEGTLTVPVAATAQDPEVFVRTRWQGCADAGLCYPPAEQLWRVRLKAWGATADDITPVDALPPGAQPHAPLATATPVGGADDQFTRFLSGGNLLTTLAAFALAGFLLSLTPCVLPMIPILSSIIVGQAQPVSRRRGLALAASYTVGMAVVYSAFGVAAGLAGEGLAAALQNAWVLGGFALLLAGFALSMFGWYELQMPSFIQNKASGWSNRFSGGSLGSVFCMGGVSALVCGPCVAAPLAGALVYISQTGDVWLGGSALFVMALSMGGPLLLVGASAGHLLPKAGNWMEKVKQVFGMMLLGVAIWMVSPVISVQMHMLAWALWLLLAALGLGALGHGHHDHATKRPPLVARWVGVVALALGTLELVGAASAGQSVLQPLAHLKGSAVASATPTAPSGLVFERVDSSAALDAAVAQAAAQGQRVMLDFYADWCVACKEFEHNTFSDGRVVQQLAGVRLLQADVTRNTADDKQLLKRFALFGPPGIVFFDPAGTPSGKVVGYEPAPAFIDSVRRVWPDTAPREVASR